MIFSSSLGSMKKRERERKGNEMIMEMEGSMAWEREEV